MQYSQTATTPIRPVASKPIPQTPVVRARIRVAWCCHVNLIEYVRGIFANVH